jgi:uncharacterized protein (DUF849 family)
MYPTCNYINPLEIKRLSKYHGCDPYKSLSEDASSFLKYAPSQNPLGIVLAPTGMLPVKPGQKGRVVTSHVPVEANEIVETVIECYELGIGGVHLHARDPDGKPTQDPDVFAEITEKIRRYCSDIIIGVTTSGRQDPSYKGRSKVLDIQHVDVASLTLTSVQFPQSTVVADEATVVRLLKKMQRNNIKPEFEFFDTGSINMLKRLQQKQLYPEGPIYCNIFVGNLSSTQANLMDIVRLTKSLPFGSYCGLGGFGGFQLKANVAAIMMGGMMHVRTGLEDNIYYDRDRHIMATNRKLVKRIVEISKYFERPVATPNQMREMMGLKTIENSSRLHRDRIVA